MTVPKGGDLRVVAIRSPHDPARSTLNFLLSGSFVGLRDRRGDAAAGRRQRGDQDRRGGDHGGRHAPSPLLGTVGAILGATP